MSSDRRAAIRVPVELFLSAFVRDRPFRALAENLSETGIFLTRAGSPRGRREPAPPPPTVALELALPGTGDTLWARGEIRYRRRGELVHQDGIRFTGMARRHARLLRDFCLETRRAHLRGVPTSSAARAEPVESPARRDAGAGWAAASAERRGARPLGPRTGCAGLRDRA